MPRDLGLLVRKIIRPLLAWTLLLVLVAAVFGFVVYVFNVYNERDNDLARLGSQLARFTSIANFAPKLDKLEKARAADVSASYLLSASTAAIAKAKLQKLTKQMAKKRRVFIASVRELKVAKSGDIELVGINIQLSGPFTSVVRFLADAQNRKPALLLDRVVILADTNPQRSTSKAARLSVDLDLYVGVSPDPNPNTKTQDEGEAE